MNEVKEENDKPTDSILISQSVAILVDGNKEELNTVRQLQRFVADPAFLRIDTAREGERLHNYYHGSVRPCHKSADIPLSIFAVQVANKVDTIIIMSGDADYIELVRHLKSEGVRVEIAAVANTTSKLMIEEADYFHEITSEHWFTLPNKKPQKRKKN